MRNSFTATPAAGNPHRDSTDSDRGLRQGNLARYVAYQISDLDIKIFGFPENLIRSKQSNIGDFRWGY